MEFLNSFTHILHLHTSNQEASTGWARPKRNNIKTPNWFIICLLCNKFEFAGIFISKLKIYTVFRDILSIWQLHILLSRTAQISLELHFCAELHIKKGPSKDQRISTNGATFSDMLQHLEFYGVLQHHLVQHDIRWPT